MRRFLLWLAIHVSAAQNMHIGYSNLYSTRLLVAFPENEANSWWCAVLFVCTEVSMRQYCTNGNISTSDGTITTPYFGLGRRQIELSYHFANDEIVKYSFVFNISSVDSLPNFSGRIAVIPQQICTSGECNSYITYESSLRLFLTPIGIAEPERATVALDINGEPFEGLTLRPWGEFCTNISFEVQFGTEYLTYFITAQGTFHTGDTTYPTTRYIESLPHLTTLQNTDVSQERLRYFSTEWQSSPLPMTLPKDDMAMHHVCMYFDESVDGMKQKMLNIIKALPSEHFTWSFFACPSTRGAASIVPYLNQIPNADVYPCIPGVSLTAENAREKPLHNDLLSLDEYVSLHATPDSTYLSMAYQYAYWRLQQANYSIDRVTPPWSQLIWTQLLETLHQPPMPCDMLIFGNDRSPMSTLFTAAAHLLRIPSVMELPNLYPHRLVRPDYVVSDSAFGLYHSSLAHLFNESSNHHTQGVIISPGVDVLATQIKSVAALYTCPEGCPMLPSHDALFSRGGRVKHRCGHCFVIGMICRMAKEKAVGLFLQAAAVVAEECSFCRFVIAGDGPLRHHLETLAYALGLESRVKFVGWVAKDDIAVLLSGWDVIVNTGAWREIFNGANLDALSIALPLITYASGGVGEYIADPALTDQSPVLNYLNEYLSVDNIPIALSDNAVVVQTTTPEALAVGIMFLRDHDDIRSSIGYNGMKTAEKYFQISRTMQAYQNLFYTILAP